MGVKQRRKLLQQQIAALNQRVLTSSRLESDAVAESINRQMAELGPEWKISDWKTETHFLPADPRSDLEVDLSFKTLFVMTFIMVRDKKK